MVNRVVVPTLLVAAMWIIVSLSTTVYVLWLDASYQADFEQHVKCTETTSMLLEHLWHLQADRVDELAQPADRQQRDAELVANLESDVSQLAAIAGPPQHVQLVDEISRLAPQYRAFLDQQETPGSIARDSAGPRQLADRLADRATRLRELHHHLLNAAADSRSSVTMVVLWIRAMTLLIGPLLGWWMARRLGRVVNEIRITLESQVGLTPDEVGAIQIWPGDDLTWIRQQVEAVVERLRTTAAELKQAHHEVLRSDRLAAIGRLAAGVAHELRNPLTSVKLLIQYTLLPGNASLTEEQLRLILEEIERVETTIQGLLDLSRSIPMQRARHDLRETLARAAQLVSGRAARQNVDVALQTGPAPLLIDGDIQQLHQVCVNLYLNAIEAMPEGGTLKVVAHRSAVSTGIQVEVRDTGPGIREDLLPTLFEPFVTSKERGTGLGLAISQRIVESHGGAIRAANLPAGGAAFLVTFPASRISPAPEPAQLSAPALAVQPERDDPWPSYL